MKAASLVSMCILSADTKHLRFKKYYLQPFIICFCPNINWVPFSSRRLFPLQIIDWLFFMRSIYKIFFTQCRSSLSEVFYKIAVLKNFTEKHLYRSDFLNKIPDWSPVTLLKKKTSVQVISFEFCEISRIAFL